MRERGKERSVWEGERRGGRGEGTDRRRERKEECRTEGGRERKGEKEEMRERGREGERVEGREGGTEEREGGRD